MTASSHLIAGQVQCRVRTLTDSNGKNIKKVTPGTAVSVAGWKDLPNAGDEVIQASEDDIKRAVTNRKRNADVANLIADVSAINEKRRLEREKREHELEAAKEALESGKVLPVKPVDRPELEASEDGPKTLRLIIKADVSGSAEAVAGALEGIGNDKATTKIIQYGVGNVTESDINMAKAANGRHFTSW
jgi:translation initiation factor IF-2